MRKMLIGRIVGQFSKEFGMMKRQILLFSNAIQSQGELTRLEFICSIWAFQF